MKQVINEDCLIECIDNGKIEHADIINFSQNSFLTVSIKKSLKLQLQFNETSKKYTGKMAGLTFISDGPIIRNVSTSRN